MVPGSPYIAMPCNGLCNATNSDYMIVIEKEGLDNDPLMNEVLDNPKAAYDVLARIYQAHKTNKVDIKGTKLAKHLMSKEKMYQSLFNRLVQGNPFIATYGPEVGVKMGNENASLGCKVNCDYGSSGSSSSIDYGEEESCKIINEAGLMGPCADYSLSLIHI